MSKNKFTFERDGHTYRVVPVEGSENKYVAIRDGIKTHNLTYDEVFDGDEVNYDGIINLF